MKAVAVDLAVVGDIDPLWRAWLHDAARRGRVELDPASLDEQLPNWRALLERFAENHAPVYLRPRGDVSALLRRLAGAGTRIGAFTDAPIELAQVALAHLGASRRVAVVGTLRDVLADLGPGAIVVRTVDELARAAA